LSCFGSDDNDLILIHYFPYTNTVSMMWHPKYAKDKSYYENKVEQLKKYFLEQ
jgi:hypothetical protein